MAKINNTPSQAQLREIFWDIGTQFSPPIADDHLALAAIHPHLGYLHWQVQEASVADLRKKLAERFEHAALVLRIYDVTDIIFDGLNAHSFFDIDIGRLSGNHYLNVSNAGHAGRNLLAEVGFRLRDNAFCALARSNVVLFDRDRPSAQLSLNGLYVGPDFVPVFALENTADAAAFEQLNAQTPVGFATRPTSVAVVRSEVNSTHEKPIAALVDRMTARLSDFSVRIHQVSTATSVDHDAQVEQIAALHETQRFELIHAHDWHAIPTGLAASQKLGIPLILSLHTTEHERTRGDLAAASQHDLNTPYLWEQRGVDRANRVIVPDSATRQTVINRYGGTPERIAVIADVFEQDNDRVLDPAQAKRDIGCDPNGVLALFAGEISHAAGADLLVEAAINVCHENGAAQFVFAGNGPLRGELEGKIWHAGFGHRCRFFGDVASDWFDRVLLASDFVVIPARTWQDESLAQRATAFGKPVLTTHQANIRCITHGQNGLITYDNPGSIIWGVKELIANPLHGNMMHMLAQQRSTDRQSLERSLAELMLTYRQLLDETQR